MEVIARRADARANRAHIIAATQDVLREHGIDAEIKEIAERAGVGIGTLYRNFPTKDDLIAAVALEMLDTMRQLVDAAVVVDDPIAAIRQLLRGGAEIADHYGDLMEVLMHAKTLPQCAGHFDPAEFVGRVVAIVQKGVARGVFRPDLDAELAATSLAATFHPAMLRILRRTRSIEEIVDQRMEMFLRGVRSGDPR